MCSVKDRCCFEQILDHRLFCDLNAFWYQDLYAFLAYFEVMLMAPPPTYFIWHTKYGNSLGSKVFNHQQFVGMEFGNTDQHETL